MTIRIVGLEDLFVVRSSKRVLKSEWRTSGVPFFRGREVTALAQSGTVNNQIFISEEHYRSLAQSYGVPKTDDILVTAIGTIGNTYIVQAGDRFYFKDASVLWLEKKVEVNSRYVRYWFASNSFREQLPIGNGATVDTLPIQALSRMKIELPNLAEQQRIVAKLDEVDAGLRILSECLEAELLRSAQVRLSATDNLMLRAGGNKITLGSACEVIAGQSPEGIHYNQNGVGEPFYQGKKEFGDRFVGAATTWTTRVTKQANSGDIVMSVRAPVGPVNILRSSACIGRGLAAIRPRSGVDRDFIYYQLQAMQNQIAGTEGAIFASINKGQIEALPIWLPPLAEQRRIVAKIEDLQSVCAEVSANIVRRKSKTVELRQSVLAAAFRGEL